MSTNENPTPHAPFKAYRHVENIHSDEVEGILQGTVYIQPKLDGTNAVVWSDGSMVYAGSRKRQITCEDDNGKFAAWLYGESPDAKALRAWAREHPYVYIFGEWLADPTALKSKFLGAIKDYTEKGFFIFDLFDAHHSVYVEFSEMLWDDLKFALIHNSQAHHVHLVPVLAKLEFPSLDDIVALARHDHYMLPSHVVGEGVTLKNFQFVNTYGRSACAKVINEDYKKHKSQKPKRAATIPDAPLSYQECYDLVSPSLVTKAKAKVALEWSNTHSTSMPINKHVGQTIQRVLNDFLAEELKDVLKSHKYPTIDFMELKRAVTTRVRQEFKLE